MRVASIGDGCIDRYLRPVEETHAGGNAANVAAGLALAGHDVLYAGGVGDDAEGRLLVEGLGRTGVDTSLVATLPGVETAVCVVELRRDGERVFLEERLGANGVYAPPPRTLEALSDRAWVHAAGLRGDPAALARLGGPRISYDFAQRETPEQIALLSPLLEIAFFSGARLTRDQGIGLARAAMDHGAGAAVVTRGEHGALAIDPAGLIERAAEPVAVVDTLGAGDALIAAVISARLAGAALGQALDDGARAAARACTHRGAWTACG
jgi:fructoselysine 6-kinase